MASEKEISSTEKLLTVIRSKNDDATDPRFTEAHSPGLWEKIKNRLPAPGPRGIMGVEIFRDTLNIVRMAKDKNGWQSVYASMTALPGDAGIGHPDFPAFLKAQLRAADPSGKADIWICLPPSKGETWNVLVPKVKKGLTNAVYWSARKDRTFDESEYYFDYRITGEENDKGVRKLAARVSIASAREINLYKKVFSEAGYNITGITLPGFLLENLFAHRWIDQGDEACAALYIGDDSSYIEIRGRRTTLFNRVIKTGRDSILDSLIMEYNQQEETNGSPEPPPSGDRQKAAQMLRQQAGISGKEQIDMIQPALERLARQLERTIDHCVNVLDNPAPERIYICGAISFLPGLSDFFSQQLGIPAVIMDIPEQEITITQNKLFSDSDQRLSLVSTAGLAMPLDNTVNFLHTTIDMDREKQALRNANIVAAMCALLFVAAGAWWWSARHELEAVREEKAVLENRLEQFSPQLTPEDLAGLAGKFKEKNDELRKYSRRLYPVAAVKEITRVTPESIKLVAMRLENSPGRPGGRGEKTPVCTLEGFIKSEPSMYETRLTGYLLQLRRSAIFNDPSVVKSQADTLASGEKVYRFTLNIKLAVI
ncbi:MAG: hypothetical protein ACLFNW_01225 [Desulfobacterales bacterium]